MRVLGTCVRARKAVPLQRQITLLFYAYKFSPLNYNRMKKFTLFLAALCCTVAAQAVDYTIKFAVNGTVKFSVKLPEGASANTVLEYGETMRGQVVLPDYYTFREWDQEFAEVTQNVTYNALYIMKDGVLYYQVDEPTETAFVTYEVLYDNNYKNLTGSVTFPASIRDNSMEFQVTGVGDYAFYGCSGLTSVTIPNSVTSIGDGAFYECSGLTSISIPNSVTSIGLGAFYGCSSLTSPVYNAHVFAYMPTSYSGAYTIQDGIESIAGGAFYGCSGLTSVTIPNSVTSIGEGAFYGCSSLTTITCKAINPPTLGDNVFTKVDTTIPLYVPAQSVSAYQAADGWDDFMDNTYPIQSTAINQTTIPSDRALGQRNHKRIQNGQLYLMYNGTMYNVQGAEVK